MLSETECRLLNKKRENEFTIDVDYSQENGMTFKTVKVTTPNKYGIFKIITQIGDEISIIRLISINNENIVKRC